MQPNKLGIVLQVLPCAVIAMVAGGVALLDAVRASDWRIPVAWVGCVGILGVGFLWLGGFQTPADDRVYTLETPVRLEHAQYTALERERALSNFWLPDVTRIAAYSPPDWSRKFGDLGHDLTTRGGVRAEPRPVDPLPTAQSAMVTLSIDLTTPLVGRQDWVRRAAERTSVDWAAGGNPAKSRFTAPDVSWSNLSPHVGIAYRPELGRLDIALEFGEMYWFGDLAPDIEPSQSALKAPMFTIQVPAGTSIRVTEVVADHFSRYYRWWVQTDPVTVSGEPTVVFTN